MGIYNKAEYTNEMVKLKTISLKRRKEISKLKAENSELVKHNSKLKKVVRSLKVLLTKAKNIIAGDDEEKFEIKYDKLLERNKRLNAKNKRLEKYVNDINNPK